MNNEETINGGTLPEVSITAQASTQNATGKVAVPAIGIGGVAFLIMMTLKLTKKTDISWWWVTSPLWGPVGLVLILFLIGYISTRSF